jgi:hypothetical protein
LVLSESLLPNSWHANVLDRPKLPIFWTTLCLLPRAANISHLAYQNGGKFFTYILTCQTFGMPKFGSQTNLTLNSERRQAQASSYLSLTEHRWSERMADFSLLFIMCQKNKGDIRQKKLKKIEEK